MTFQTITNIEQLKSFSGKFIAYHSNDPRKRLSGGFELDEKSFGFVSCDEHEFKTEGKGFVFSRLVKEGAPINLKTITEKYIQNSSFEARIINPDEARSIQKLIEGNEAIFELFKDALSSLQPYLQSSNELLMTPRRNEAL